MAGILAGVLIAQPLLRQAIRHDDGLIHIRQPRLHLHIFPLVIHLPMLFKLVEPGKRCLAYFTD